MTLTDKLINYNNLLLEKRSSKSKPSASEKGPSTFVIGHNACKDRISITDLIKFILGNEGLAFEM